MRTRFRRFAHVLERSGLAMAGAACGLFVGAYVGQSISALTTLEFVVAMMISGVFGFYLGIDTPPEPFNPAGEAERGGIDTAEFLTAVGTFLTTLVAFISVGVIMLRESPHIAWTYLVLIAWVLGVAMQIIAGAIARMRT
jgi:hypothetical protein